LLIIMIWPFLDRKADRSPRAQRFRTIGVAIVMLILLVLTIWGEVT